MIFSFSSQNTRFIEEEKNCSRSMRFSLKFLDKKHTSWRKRKQREMHSQKSFKYRFLSRLGLKSGNSRSCLENWKRLLIRFKPVDMSRIRISSKPERGRIGFRQGWATNCLYFWFQLSCDQSYLGIKLYPDHDFWFGDG